MPVVFDPIVPTTSAFGNIQPLQSHYGTNQPYWLKAGSPIVVPSITANTMTINQTSPTGILVDGGTSYDASILLQSVSSASIELGGSVNQIVANAAANTVPSEIAFRSAPFGSGDNVNEIIISPNNDLYGNPTSFISQNSYKPGGVLFRQSIAKEDGSDQCFTTLSTDFSGVSQNIPTTILSVLDSNTFQVQSLTLQPSGTTITGSLEVQTGEITLGGKPASVSGKVAYANTLGTGNQWSIPALGQVTLSQQFSVVAGHTYRVSNQMLIDNADTTSETVVFVVGTGIQSRIKAWQNGADTYLNGQDGGYSCYFLAPSSVSDLTVIGQNSSATTATTLSAQQFTYFIVEDMGVI